MYALPVFASYVGANVGKDQEIYGVKIFVHISGITISLS